MLNTKTTTANHWKHAYYWMHFFFFIHGFMHIFLKIYSKNRICKRGNKRKHTTHKGQMGYSFHWWIVESFEVLHAYFSPTAPFPEEPTVVWLCALHHCAVSRTDLEDLFLKFLLICFITCHLYLLFGPNIFLATAFSFNCKFLEGTAMVDSWCFGLPSICFLFFWK